jgi:hypothetical protein
MKGVSMWLVLLLTLATGVGLDGQQKAAPDPAGAPAAVTIPAGTVVNVRLTEAINVDAAQAGMTFKARVDDPVMVDGSVVIPREAAAALQAVKVAQSGEFKGADAISLKLNSIGVGGRVVQVVSEYATIQGKGEGKRTARKVGGGAGLGAIVGGIAGGGEGALIGAAVGGIAGTAVAASGKEHLQLPAETRVQFKLTSAVKVQL